MTYHFCGSFIDVDFFNTSAVKIILLQKFVENRALVRTRVQNRGEAFGVLKPPMDPWVRFLSHVSANSRYFFEIVPPLRWELLLRCLNPFFDDFLHTSRLILVFVNLLHSF